MFVKKLNLLVVSFTILALLAACAPAQPAQPTQPAASGDEPVTIGVTMLFDDLWLTTLRDAMTEYAATQPGVELVMVDSKEDVATQLGQVENFVAQGVDAIVIVAANTDAADPMTKVAQDAGIPLVYVNRLPSNLPEGVSYVGSDSIQAGIMQAEWLAEQLGGKGNVVIMNGNLAQEAAQKRTEGEKQVFAKFPDIKIIREDTGNWSRDQGLTLMENWLASGDQIDAVASNNDEMAIGAIQAIEAAGKLGEILVGGVDASPDALQEMDKGRLDVTVFQNAKGQGEGAIKVAIALARGEQVEQMTWIPFELVTPENYKQYMNP
ncbi:MAG TPA: sugar ABC transporter substrate-binding protein [Anaerolineales bacterium]|nr:sugar ABC transporter substrate-binding protein [Anaerolineales bacterium]